MRAPPRCWKKLGAPLISGSTPRPTRSSSSRLTARTSTAVSAQGLDPARSVGLDTLYALDGAKRAA